MRAARSAVVVAGGRVVVGEGEERQRGVGTRLSGRRRGRVQANRKMADLSVSARVSA